MEKSLCSECATGKLSCVDCCTDPFIGKDPGFWLTLSDISRIVKKTNLEPEEFCRLTEVDQDGEDNGDVDEVHGELLYIKDKVILMNAKNKKCFFLGEHGCEIFNDRPMGCRIFPFEFKKEDNDAKITIKHEDTLEEDECLITKTNYNNNNIPFLLKFIGETEESMKKTIKQYLEEMNVHNKLKNQVEKIPILQVLNKNKLLTKPIISPQNQHKP